MQELETEEEWRNALDVMLTAPDQTPPACVQPHPQGRPSLARPTPPARHERSGAGPPAAFLRCNSFFR